MYVYLGGLGMNMMILIWSMRKSQDVISYKQTWMCSKTVHSPEMACVVVLNMHMHSCVCICMTQPTPGGLCAWMCVLYVRHSCVNVIRLNNTYASVFSPAARVAAPSFGLSSGHRALHGHDRWNQKRCKAITEDREEGLGRREGAELS